MKVEQFLKKGFEIRDIQRKSLNKFSLQEVKGRIKPVPWEAINGKFTLENVNVKYILEEGISLRRRIHGGILFGKL